VPAGFTVEASHDYLVCAPGSLTMPPTPDGFGLAEPATEEQRAASVSAQNEAFGGESAASAADVRRVLRFQSNGGVAVMAVTRAGSRAGGGQAVAPNGGVSEVAGMAVRKPYRQRGLGGAIAADIASRLFAVAAEIAWLEAPGEDSWRGWERVG
jgi:GNAT superfamily N-acetyltransferase